jgi:hypothetical protein
MKYTAEMGSGAMIYIQSFIKTGLGIEKLKRGYIATWRWHKPTFILLIRKDG